MKECFREGLKCVLPDCEIRGRGKGRGRVKLSDARAEEFTLGTFPVIIKENSAALGRRMKQAGEAGYDSGWWEAFAGKLFSCTKRETDAVMTACFCGRICPDCWRICSWKARSRPDSPV